MRFKDTICQYKVAAASALADLPATQFREKLHVLGTLPYPGTYNGQGQLVRYHLMAYMPGKH